MHFREFVEIDFGSLNDFHFSDSDVFDWVNPRNLFRNLLFDDIGSEKIENVSGVGLGDFSINEIGDSLSDFLLLRAEGVVRFSFLVRGFPGAGDGENSKHISVVGFDVLDCLNKRFSLFDERTELVSGGVDSVETGDCSVGFDVVDDEFDFPPTKSVLVRGEVRLHLTNDSASDVVFNLF